MTGLLLAAWLIGTPSPTGTAEECCRRPESTFSAMAETRDVDDKIGHFIAPAILTTSFYGTALYLGAEPKQARWIAAGLGVLIVVAKEVYDQRVAGRFGLEETAIGLGGVAAGVWASDRIEWPEEKRINSNRMRTNPRQ